MRRCSIETSSPGSTATLHLTVENKSASTASRAPPRSLPADKPAASPTNLRPWVWTAFAVGAAGVVAGSVFGILAIDKDAELADVCIPKHNCPPEKSATGSSSTTTRWVRTSGSASASWLGVSARRCGYERAALMKSLTPRATTMSACDVQRWGEWTVLAGLNR